MWKNLLSKANSFLRRSRLISRMAGRSSHSGIRTAGNIASALGYGRRYRRKRRGGAIKLAGMGLGLAGAGRRARHSGRMGRLTNLPMAY
jgi:hypothetical protein